VLGKGRIRWKGPAAAFAAEAAVKRAWLGL
jgi:hypothetical protein